MRQDKTIFENKHHKSDQQTSLPTIFCILTLQSHVRKPSTQCSNLHRNNVNIALASYVIKPLNLSIPQCARSWPLSDPLK